MGAVAGRLGSLRTPGGVASVRVGVVELITDVGVRVWPGSRLGDVTVVAVVGVARAGASASGLRSAAGAGVVTASGLRVGSGA